MSGRLAARKLWKELGENAIRRGENEGRKVGATAHPRGGSGVSRIVANVGSRRLSGRISPRTILHVKGSLAGAQSRKETTRIVETEENKNTSDGGIDIGESHQVRKPETLDIRIRSAVVSSTSAKSPASRSA